jgi:hypothetical protein
VRQTCVKAAVFSGGVVAACTITGVVALFLPPIVCTFAILEVVGMGVHRGGPYRPL